MNKYTYLKIDWVGSQVQATTFTIAIPGVGDRNFFHIESLFCEEDKK